MKNNWFKKRILSFGYALSGILSAFRSETHLKIHLLGFLSVLSLGHYFEFTSIEWCIILLVSSLVIGFELLNTAIEHLANEVDEKHNKRIGIVKDISAGAVLIQAFVALIIGIIILSNHL